MTDSTTDNAQQDTALSNTWQEKFALLDSIGADQTSAYGALNTPSYKALGFRQKQRISFNLLAFIFGPIYYFVKGMHYKGAALLTASWLFIALLTLVEIMIGLVLPDVLFWIPPAVICAQLANHDYYRHVRQHEKIWPGMPALLATPVGAILLPIAAFILMLALSIFSPLTESEAHDYMLDDVSGVWRGDSDGAMVQVELQSRKPTLSINGNEFPVSIDHIDVDNHVVTMDVNLNTGKSVQWTLRKIIAKDESFTLLMTLHEGTQDSLSFVRNL